MEVAGWEPDEGHGSSLIEKLQSLITEDGKSQVRNGETSPTRLFPGTGLRLCQRKVTRDFS
jgi:hypothetical protein